MAIPTEYTFLGYWGAIAMKLPTLLFFSWRAVVSIPLCILFFIALSNRQIAEHWFEKWKGVSPWWSVAVIGILLVWGVMNAIYERDKQLFTAYKATQQKTIELASKIDSFTKPQLIGHIDQIVTGEEKGSGSMELYLIVSIRNIGAPSIIDGFLLSVKNNKLNLTNISPTYIPEGYKLLNENGQVWAEFNRNITIEERAATPIQQGYVARGWVRFILSGTKLIDFRQPNTKITLSFIDYLGKEYSTEMDAKGIGTGIRYYQGAGLPFNPNFLKQEK